VFVRFGVVRRTAALGRLAGALWLELVRCAVPTGRAACTCPAAGFLLAVGTLLPVALALTRGFAEPGRAFAAVERGFAFGRPGADATGFRPAPTPNVLRAACTEAGAVRLPGAPGRLIFCIRDVPGAPGRLAIRAVPGRLEAATPGRPATFACRTAPGVLAAPNPGRPAAFACPGPRAATRFPKAGEAPATRGASADR
jgi:hypothetical protein